MDGLHGSTLHSHNLYQIFTYVKNLDKDNTGNISGILLYAQTQEEIAPNCLVCIGDNRFGARTLNLNCKFEDICEQLDDIAEMFFGEKP